VAGLARDIVVYGRYTGMVSVMSGISYDDFVKKYEGIIAQLMKYDTKQVGALHYAEQAASLADSYPDYMDQYDNEV
jgi:hypothetical protein